MPALARLADVSAITSAWRRKKSLSHECLPRCALPGNFTRCGENYQSIGGLTIDRATCTVSDSSIYRPGARPHEPAIPAASFAHCAPKGL